MASNKESTVIIIDVGAEALARDATDCSMKIIKNKILNHKVDMLSILLFRTEDTDNSANTEQPDQYLNITQVLPGSQIPTWDMARQLTTCLNYKASKLGDWVDALIVAIGIVTEDVSLHKTRLSKIVLFHNFDSQLSPLDEAIVEKLNELKCKLIIVSQNIHYIPDSDGVLQPQFKTSPKKNPSQSKNEELAMELKNRCPLTTFCNFNDALPLILSKQLAYPWTWNSTLAIGTQISINISGVIAIKEDATVPKFQKKSNVPSEQIVRQKTFYSGVDELQGDDLKEQQISGYMLGSTPMPFDPSLGQAPHIDMKKGIYTIAFTGTKNIPQEFYSGSSTYVLFAQKNKRASAMLLDSLVRVMMDNGDSILAWKVYNNSNKPKLVALMPTMEYGYSGLSMIELCYHSQQRFWDFPKLNTKRNQPSDSQLEAVDQLMASMDLSPKNDANQESMDSLSKDLLTFKFLPDISQAFLIEYLSSALLNQSTGSPAFGKIPEASDAIGNVKKQFDLKMREAPTKDKLKKHFFNGVASLPDGGDSNEMALNDLLPAAQSDDANMCTHVSTVTPAEDFTSLITNIMTKLPKGPEQAAKFHQYTCQMRSVLEDLLFKSMTKQYEKIRKALVVYQKISIVGNSSYDYNDWMRDIRAKVIERKMFDFWADVIVKEKLGLCQEEDPQVESDFYDTSKETAAASNVETTMDDDESVEDLFGNM